MTVMVGKLTSIGGQPFGGEGHAVKIFSRVTRTSTEDEAVILQLIDRIEMPSVEDGGDGTFTTADMAPGPIRVELEGSSRHGEGWDIDLPETDPEDPQPWSLGSLIGLQVEWPPVVVGRAQVFAREAGEHADRAEAGADRAEAGADRVGTAEQVETWASDAQVAAETASTAASQVQSTVDNFIITFTEDPPGSGLYAVPTAGFTPDPDNPGLYLIGA